MLVCSTSLSWSSTLKKLRETSLNCDLGYIPIDRSRLFMNRGSYHGVFSIDDHLEHISFGADFNMALMPYGDR